MCVGVWASGRGRVVYKYLALVVVVGLESRLRVSVRYTLGGKGVKGVSELIGLGFRVGVRVRVKVRV